MYRGYVHIKEIKNRLEILKQLETDLRNYGKEIKNPKVQLFALKIRKELDAVSSEYVIRE